MNSKIKRNRDKDFNEPALSIDKVADADTVIGKSIITVSGSEVIPLSSVTVVNLSGGGEYGDIKTFKESDGFKLAGGNGTVITVKPKGFLVDDGNGCRLLKMDESPLDSLIDKTGELVHKISDNA
ncbi:MAG: sporulation protein YtfJ [Clostridia bacterium]|nr:sporulation protein YtfJ [Clostridia bacterium]